MAAIPADGTWFDTLNKSFADVPIDAAKDDAISTAEFLEAAEALVTLFGEYCRLTACRYSTLMQYFFQTSSAPQPSVPSRMTCWATSRSEVPLFPSEIWTGADIYNRKSRIACWLLLLSPRPCRILS